MKLATSGELTVIQRGGWPAGHRLIGRTSVVCTIRKFGNQQPFRDFHREENLTNRAYAKLKVCAY